MPEDPSSYQTPSYLEKVQSQLPALQLLTEMGWEYLPPEKVAKLRGERLGAAILEADFHCYRADESTAK